MLAVDHLPFAVHDVESIARDLERLGFTTTATGTCRWTQDGRAHESRATSVVFERTYFDLIEFRDADWAAQLRASPLHQRGIVSTGVVLGAPALEPARAALADRGLASDEPYEIVRQLHGAEPPRILYRIFSLRGCGLPFAVIEDSAPRALRRPHWLRHANGATGVRAVHLRVSALDEARPRAAQVLDPSARPAVALHGEPDDPYLAEISALLPRRDRPALLALELDCAELGAARACLEANGIAHRANESRVAIDPKQGYACGLVFRAGEGTT